MAININLLPWREELKIQKKIEFLMMLCLAFISTAGLIICIHMIISRQVDFQNDINNYLKAELCKLDQQIIEIQNLEKEKKQLLAKMQIIQRLQTSRPQIVELFDGIVRILPQGLYLTNLSRTGNRILIDGKAESNTRVSTFMRNIEASTWLTSPELSLIQAADKKQDDKFSKPIDKLIGFSLQALEVTAASSITLEKSAEKPVIHATSSTASNGSIANH